ncbi:NADPH-dependent FMN reductase [Methylobacillus flagellatus]|uniref:NADPH-dependent FMN reductase n=1 Tax=Methylobacillus flagellatus (strain ATCC 51484 / DSM 6875 / VKM B-1610 / KT) TaxID=265072 RepID=Q1H100_METFK|nr:NAD(P)H-dependent oxidoreductase [Methylobacillus flagellatus]ABE49837.1 NADPH-dependent FMN reductase [Methylobacillus flagellatus KT]
MARIVGISGSLSQPSRTRALVEEIAARASHQLHAPAEVIDIAGIAAVLGSTVSYGEFPPELSEAYEKVQAADLLVIASPVYKASYTGLLKHFFDLLDPKALVGKVAILGATGGSDQHAMILDYQLRTLVSFFSVYTAPTAIYARDSEFAHYQLTSDAIRQRIAVAVDQAEFLLKHPQVPQVLVA